MARFFLNGPVNFVAVAAKLLILTGSVLADTAGEQGPSFGDAMASDAGRIAPGNARNLAAEPNLGAKATLIAPHVIAGVPSTKDSPSPTDAAPSMAASATASTLVQSPGPVQLGAVARRAEDRIAYAFELAERGAVFSARSELVKALRLIAEAFDAQKGTQLHGQALEAGLTALRESDDFAPEQWHHEMTQNARNLLASHRTPVLKDTDLSQLTPGVALQAYYHYAAEQLAQAGEHEPAASRALYGLARAELAAAGGPGSRKSLGSPKAIALHQAALIVDPKNYMAANELAVLLARYGQAGDAEVLLRQSLEVSSQPETWHNLAVVYETLGRQDAAQQARARYESLVATNRQASADGPVSTPGSASPAVRWVDPKAMESINDMADVNGVPFASEQTAESPPGPKADSRKQGSSSPQLFFWLKSKLPRPAN